MKRINAVVGNTAGRWTIIGEPYLLNKNYVVPVRCSCNARTEGMVQVYQLGVTSNSCGCLRAEQQRARLWKGGRTKLAGGYIGIWNPDHPNAEKLGYVREHILVMSEHLGRPLIKGENVHHKNGDRADNRIENLELWSTSQPYGQRVSDKIAWAKEILALYGEEIEDDD